MMQEKNRVVKKTGGDSTLDWGVTSKLVRPKE